MLNRLSVGCSHTGTIHSEPAGAEIFVDGESKGHSPVTFEEKSSGGGTVQVKAKLNGQEVTKAVERSDQKRGQCPDVYSLHYRPLKPLQDSRPLVAGRDEVTISADLISAKLEGVAELGFHLGDR